MFTQDLLKSTKVGRLALKLNHIRRVDHVIPMKTLRSHTQPASADDQSNQWQGPHWHVLPAKKEGSYQAEAVISLSELDPSAATFSLKRNPTGHHHTHKVHAWLEQQGPSKRLIFSDNPSATAAEAQKETQRVTRSASNVALDELESTSKDAKEKDTHGGKKYEAIPIPRAGGGSHGLRSRGRQKVRRKSPKMHLTVVGMKSTPPGLNYFSL